MDKILQSFQNKKFKYGTFSTITAIIVIAVLIVTNLLAGLFDISYDLTGNKMYSLTDDTVKIINELNEDVTIYALFKTGQENDLFKELVSEYQSKSSKVSVQFKDPYLYPQFVEQYTEDGEEIPVNSIIVESARRHKLINASEMVTYGYDMESFSQYVQSIDIEPQVTNAIRYVTSEETSVIYTLTGHSEAPLSDALKKQIGYSNYDFKEVDLLIEDRVPEDCDLLFITQPQRDWAPDEAEYVRTYLQNDGNAIFTLDYSPEKFVNIESVLNTYGVELTRGLIVEGNTKNYFQNTPFYLLPDYKTHDITNTLVSKGYKTLVLYGVGINQLAVKKNSITVEPLLVTSSDAYGKANAQSQSINKEQGDLDGPFNVALAITDSYYTNEQHFTKLVVIGSSLILDEGANTYIGGSNYDFIVNSVNWLNNRSDSVYIKPKTLQSSGTLFMDQGQAFMLMIISVIVIPLAIIVVGLVVWLRRRHS